MGALALGLGAAAAQIGDDAGREHRRDGIRAAGGQLFLRRLHIGARCCRLRLRLGQLHGERADLLIADGDTAAALLDARAGAILRHAGSGDLGLLAQPLQRGLPGGGLPGGGAHHHIGGIVDIGGGKAIRHARGLQRIGGIKADGDDIALLLLLHAQAFKNVGDRRLGCAGAVDGHGAQQQPGGNELGVFLQPELRHHLAGDIARADGADLGVHHPLIQRLLARVVGGEGEGAHRGDADAGHALVARGDDQAGRGARQQGHEHDAQHQPPAPAQDLADGGQRYRAAADMTRLVKAAGEAGVQRAWC